MGTGIAAAVAQTAQQAEQLARKRDKRTREARDASERTREIFETHLKVLEENDDTETTARLQVETDLTHYANTVPGADSRPTYDKPPHAAPHPAPHPPPHPTPHSTAEPAAQLSSQTSEYRSAGGSAENETADPRAAQTPRQVYQQQAKQPDGEGAAEPRPSLDVEA